MKKKLWYASAPCGAGKTYQLVEKALRLCSEGRKVLLAQPTTLLAEKTFENEFGARTNCPPVKVFNSATVGQGVAKQLAEYLANPPDDGPQVIICTHQVLAHLPYLTTGSNWHLLIDECPQVHKESDLNLHDTHRLITDNIRIEHYNEKYSRVIVTDDEALKQIGYNKNGDEVYGVLQETARILINPHWETFVHRKQYASLLAGESQKLLCHSLLPPSVVSAFGSVFICGANFEESAIYKLWQNDIDWRRSSKFEAQLRHVRHENGPLLTIYYATDGNWTRTICTGASEDISNLVRIRNAAAEIFQDRPIVWQANKPVSDRLFADEPFKGASRLPNNPLGLNSYSGYHDLVFLSALNPSPAHCVFLKDRGVKSDQIAAMQYLETLYQSAMRISLRDPDDPNPKTIIVPDRRAALYLAEKLPGATISKLETGIVEERKKSGRTKLHANDAERNRKWRESKREEKRKQLFELLSAAQDHGEGCPPIMCNETTIDITSNFVAGVQCWGTIYDHKKSKDASGYLQFGTISDFVDALEFWSTKSWSSKESIPLFSPATFDPAKAEGTNRAIANIVAVRNLFLDFENGDLTPKTFSDLFPDLMMVITNTYNNTAEHPRFRVIILTERPVPPNVHEALWDEVEARLEDNGYVRQPAKDSNHARSGLDRSKRSAASLFRIPSQGALPSNSFFTVCSGPGRQPLDPEEWLKTARIRIPAYEVIDAPAIQPIGNGVDQVQIQLAIDRCHSARMGDGNYEFFMLALRLRDLGMDLTTVQTTLMTVAPTLRSRSQRIKQIPSIMHSLQANRSKASA